MLSAHKLSHTCKTPILGCFVYGTTCARITWSVDYLWGELMKIGSTCARTTCVSGLLVTGSLWTLGHLVREQRELQAHLSHGWNEHWALLLNGTVEQGRVKVESTCPARDCTLHCLCHTYSIQRWRDGTTLVTICEIQKCPFFCFTKPNAYCFGRKETNSHLFHSAKEVEFWRNGFPLPLV